MTVICAWCGQELHSLDRGVHRGCAPHLRAWQAANPGRRQPDTDQPPPPVVTPPARSLNLTSRLTRPRPTRPPV